MNYANAMQAQHVQRQDDAFRKEGIGDFLDKKYRPGLGGHEKGRVVTRRRAAGPRRGET